MVEAGGSSPEPAAPCACFFLTGEYFADDARSATSLDPLLVALGAPWWKRQLAARLGMNIAQSIAHDSARFRIDTRGSWGGTVQDFLLDGVERAVDSAGADVVAGGGSSSSTASGGGADSSSSSSSSSSSGGSGGEGAARLVRCEEHAERSEVVVHTVLLRPEALRGGTLRDSYTLIERGGAIRRVVDIRLPGRAPAVMDRILTRKPGTGGAIARGDGGGGGGGGGGGLAASSDCRCGGGGSSVPSTSTAVGAGAAAAGVAVARLRLWGALLLAAAAPQQAPPQMVIPWRSVFDGVLVR